MRDRRFIASHRGGRLARPGHHFLSDRATACAGNVLHLFAAHSPDDRPRRAVEVARAWAGGTLRGDVAQKAAVAVHAAAREATDRSAVVAARAAGHAAATAHFAEHSLGAALYALKAVEASGGSVRAERTWQLGQLPSAGRALVESALESERMRRVSPNTSVGTTVAAAPGRRSGSRPHGSTAGQTGPLDSRDGLT